MILAPATMTAEKDPKKAAEKCLAEVGLDPDSYRCGHTKARIPPPPPSPPCYLFMNIFTPIDTA